MQDRNTKQHRILHSTTTKFYVFNFFIFKLEKFLQLHDGCMNYMIVMSSSNLDAEQ
jgi:hypothetical protein